MLDSGQGGYGIPGLKEAYGGQTSAEGGTKRPALQFSVPCLEVSEDKGPPSFKYIFYELPFPQFPFKFPENAGFFIANGWCNGKGEFRQRMKIFGPKGKGGPPPASMGLEPGTDMGGDAPLVDTKDQPFSLKERETPFMAINFIQGFEFREPGTYRIQILLNEEVVLEYPMVVRLAEPGQQPGQQPKS